MEKKKELGTLLHHNGSVGKIEFVPNENRRSNWAISSGEDGKLILWRKKDWTALLEIQAHHEAASYHYSPVISVHPTGRLCLSIGTETISFFFFSANLIVRSSLRATVRIKNVGFNKWKMCFP